MDDFYTARINVLPNFTMLGSKTGADMSKESIFSLVSVLGSSISLVGLVFAFITYSLFSDLRNLSGTALMNFLAALFMTQLLYVIGVGEVQKNCNFLEPFTTRAVYWIAIIFIPFYWVFQSFVCRNNTEIAQQSTPCETPFGLTTVAIAGGATELLSPEDQKTKRRVKRETISRLEVGINTFRDNANLLSLVDRSIKTSFWQFSIFGWCSPIILLLLSIFLQARENGSFFNVTDLKVTNCWFLSHEAFLYGFTLPVCFLIVLIVVSLIRTSFIIRQTVSIQVDKKTRDKMKKKRKLQLFLFVKLTTVISSVFFLSALYKFTKAETFWITFNVMQGLQGIIIALCVTCNCQVLKIYTRSLRKRRKPSQYGGINKELSKSTSLQMLTWDPTPDSV